jgi:hypothetical protein
MNIRLGLIAALGVCMTTLPAAAANQLYVSASGSDTNNGSTSAPLRTIAEAALRAQPGTTVHVQPGEYDGGFVTRTSGTADHPITFISDIRWAAHITPGFSPYDMAWDSRGAYVVIDGFDVDGSRTPHSWGRWRIGIYAAGSHSVVRNNHVHNIAQDAPCTNQGGAGVEGDSYYRGQSINLIDNIVHDIGSDGCRFVQGLYQTASGKVVGNIAYRVSGWGIHLWHDAHNIEIAHNIIFDNQGGGILVGGGDFVHTRGPADHITVTDNIVFGNAYGIMESGATGVHNRFMRNLCYGNKIDWRLQTGTREEGTPEVRIGPWSSG